VCSLIHLGLKFERPFGSLRRVLLIDLPKCELRIGDAAVWTPHDTGPLTAPERGSKVVCFDTPDSAQFRDKSMALPQTHLLASTTGINAASCNSISRSSRRSI
jgi:hypothetical protein